MFLVFGFILCLGPCHCRKWGREMKKVLHISGVIEYRDRDLKDTEHDEIVGAGGRLKNRVIERLGLPKVIYEMIKKNCAADLDEG